MLTEKQFQALLRRADSRRLSDGDRADYWIGYMRGLRRHYHGEDFGDPGEHEHWMTLIDRSDTRSQSRGQGYRDGLAGDDSTRPCSPSPAAIRDFMKRYKITGAVAADMAYLSGSQAVRKYTGGANPHRMSGAVWFALHAHTMLSPETIADIEAAMRADCKDDSGSG